MDSLMTPYVIISGLIMFTCFVVWLFPYTFGRQGWELWGVLFGWLWPLLVLFLLGVFVWEAVTYGRDPDEESPTGADSWDIVDTSP